MKRILLLVLCLALFACTEEPKPGKIVSIELTEENLTILVGDFESTIAYVEKDNPANCNSTVEWSSSNESIAVAHANGDECLIEGISPGEAIITANTPEGLSATCKVTVVAKVIPVTGISLSRSWLEILENRTEILTAFLKPSDATNTKVTWSSTDESVATVNDGTVRGIKPGRAKIKAETEDGGFVAECDVTVTKDYQSQSKGPVTLKLGNVTASTVTFFGTLDVDQLGDYDMDDGGVGFIYTTTDKTLNVSNAKKVKITTVGSNNEFSFTYTGLPYDTRYHYTVFLYKNGICQYGSTQYFKTEDVNINVDEVTTGTSSAIFKGTTNLLWGDRSAINVGIQYSKYDSFSSATTINLSDSTETFEYKREGLAYATKYYYRTYIKQNSSYEYGETKEFTTLHPYNAPADLNVASATDLSYSVSANCYIVSQTGLYKFKTVKGNSSTSVGSVASASILWETFGTSTTPELCELIQGVCYKDSYIAFQTADTFKEGNAVVVAKDASGNILWSWHIWLTDQPQGQKYYNGAGTMMDRNLGATSATPGEVGALGLLYQWGRKDPFLGSSSISSNTVAKSTITWPSAESTNSSRGTVSYVIANPTTFVTASSSPYDWHYSSRDNTFWTTSDKAKSIYDPCPAGWRVPDGGDDGVWSKALGSSSDFTNSLLYNSYDEGMEFSGKFGSASTIWYPASGFRNDDAGSLYHVGSSGSYWSASPYNDYAYRLYFYYDGRVSPSDYYCRASGRSVRCLQESK